MNDHEKDLLKSHLTSIINNLSAGTFNNVLDYVYEHGLLPEDDYLDLLTTDGQSHSSAKNNVRNLLKLIRHSPNTQVFVLFCEALKHAGHHDLHRLITSSSQQMVVSAAVTPPSAASQLHEMRLQQASPLRDSVSTNEYKDSNSGHISSTIGPPVADGNAMHDAVSEATHSPSRVQQHGGRLWPVQAARVDEATPPPTLPSASVAAYEQRQFVLRGYQQEVGARLGQGHNDIIILPTGTGKTAIAVDLIVKHLMSQDAPKVIFMAPRVTLVEQQIAVIRARIPLKWASHCKKLTGGDTLSMDELKDCLEGEAWPVIVATPQIILNYFWAFSDSTVSSFTLLIFDEFHHAKGENPYRALLNQYIGEKYGSDSASKPRLPQLVGLTATVGIGAAKGHPEAVAFIKEMCASIDLESQPTAVVAHKEELELSYYSPSEEPVIVDFLRRDEFMGFIRHTVVAEIKRFLSESVCTVSATTDIKYDEPKDLSEISFYQKCVKAIDVFSKLHDVNKTTLVRESIAALEHLKLYHEVHRSANLARSSDAFRYLDSRMAKDGIYHGSRFWHQYNDTWRQRLQHLSDEEVENPKLTELRRVLECRVNWTGEEESPRVLVFCEDRFLTQLLRDYLRDLDERFKVERFVSANISADQHGMTQKEARDTLEKFRCGELNVLVSTNVLSEGIDVAMCDTVIIYMSVRDMIQGVQIPGRARKRGGQVVAIIDSKLYSQYLDNKRKERVMCKALSAIREISTEQFRSELREMQMRGMSERRLRQQQEMHSRERYLSDATILCRRCGSRVGALADIRRYLRNYYLIMDVSLSDKVSVAVTSQAGACIDGMTDFGELKCRQPDCLVCLGKVVKVIGRHFGIWDIEKIRLEGSRCNYPKWQRVERDYNIVYIQHDDLHLLADRCALSIDGES